MRTPSKSLQSLNLLVAASVLGNMSGLYAQREWVTPGRKMLPDVERPFPQEDETGLWLSLEHTPGLRH
ncbi:hypothetical protein [Silvimonas iriomotensis]|uniref:Uncharacterized protein n=1 Tax=Silvimonas iriomotensis TaxID=449662 RepID=A0ABQ2P4Z6_9NEIS|nr:hypothetical protein [Silvimonas iriomotensis]GGP18003.1 hypothetical protein GCM10010970_02650 [Silvimonas iriomotensis]